MKPSDNSSSLSTRFPAGTGLRFAAAYAALFLPFAVATPYLQVLLRTRGYDKDQIGLILGTLEIMAVLAPPLWGYLADRTCRPRTVLFVAAIGTIPMFLLFGVVRGGFAAVAVAVAFGLFFKPLIPLTDGLTFRYIRTHGGDYGKIRVGGSVAFIVCVITLEILGISEVGKGTMILVAMTVASLLHLCSVAGLPPEREFTRGKGTPHSEQSMDLRVFLKRPFLLFTLAAFLGRLAMMSYYGFFSLYLKEEIGFAQAGYLWILGPLSEFPVIYYSRRIMERIGVRNLFALGLLGITVRLAGFGVSSCVWHIIPLQFLHSLTFGAYHTASVTYVSRIVPHRLHSIAQTVFAAITIGLGGIIGGALGGHLAEQYGYHTMYLSFSAVALAALVLLMMTVPHLSEENAAPPSD